MGPRSIVRGNKTELAYEGNQCALQWGRNRSIAEMIR